MKFIYVSLLLLVSVSSCNRPRYNASSTVSASASASIETTVVKISRGRAHLSDGSRIDISGLRSDEAHAIFLVRHAEKQGGKDPALTDKGQARAERLATILDKVDISQIRSTQTQRTIQTVTPLSTDKSLEIESYVASDLVALAQSLAEFQGGNIVVAGHSNTTPQLANALLGEQAFSGDFDHEDYGNLLIVSIDGSGESSLVQLRY